MLHSKAAIQDDAGSFFPDSVAAPFIAQAGEIAPLAVAAPAPEQPLFTLGQSRDLIVAALEEFDPALGGRARALFEDGFDRAAAASRAPGFAVDWDRIAPGAGRWRLMQVKPGEVDMMRSVPAEAAACALYPANPNPYAVIDYKFDGTAEGVVYLAHEAGHSIADFCLRAGGRRPGDTPRHMDETQAYFTQHILYDYIRRHPGLEETYLGIGRAAQACFAREAAQNLKGLADPAAAHGRPLAFFTAYALLRQTQMQTQMQAQAQAAGARRRSADALLGGSGPADIARALAWAGIEYPQDMEKLARRTLEGAARAAEPSRAPVPARKAGIQSPDP
jgi:hypothetical protein